MAGAFGANGPDDEGNDLMFVLEMSDSFITYRSRYRLNPNLAPPGLIAAVPRRLGLDGDAASALGAAIFDWRMPGRRSVLGGLKERSYEASHLSLAPPNQPFESDDEVSSVIGMTADVMRVPRPFLSVYNEEAVDTRFAAPALRLAIEDNGTNQMASREASETFEIRAMGQVKDGGAFTLWAVIRFGGAGSFRILIWGVP